jgi:hypothetical protein
MKNAISLIIGLVITLAFFSGIGLALFKMMNWFQTLSSDVAIAIVAASATVITSTIAVVLGRYLESKKEREAAHRDKKIVLYDELTSRLFQTFQCEENKKNKNNSVTAEFLREVQRKLILWAGPKVVIQYAEWHKILTSSPGDPKAEAMIGMIDFYLSLREDLGLSNQGIKREHLVRFMLQQPELFMQMYQKNRDVTFAEISTAEKALKELSQPDESGNG